MNINDFNTPEEKIKFLTKTEEGRSVLKKIQDKISALAFSAIDKNGPFKDAIDDMKKQGFEINVGVSVAVGVGAAPCENFNDHDEKFLEGLGLSWEGKDEKEEAQN